MKQELISVIIPVYNVESYLSKCVNSIINQTYTNLEIILVDDGSPDNSGKICDDYAKKDKRIKVIHKKNGGLSDARNKGIEQAKGSYLSFIDSDDYIDKTMLEKLYNNLKKTNSDVAYCNFYRVFPSEQVIQSNDTVDNEFLDEEKYYLLVNKYAKVTMSACNKLYKKSIFKEIRYPKNKIMEDSHIILDILEKSNKISYIREPLYYYVQREKSIMHSFSLKHLDIIDVYEKRIDFCIKKKYYDLLEQVKKTYVYNLILKIVPGLIYINEKEKLKEIAIKIKKISKEIRNSKQLTLKEKLKFYIFSYFPITFVKLKNKLKGE